MAGAGGGREGGGGGGGEVEGGAEEGGGRADRVTSSAIHSHIDFDLVAPP